MNAAEIEMTTKVELELIIEQATYLNNLWDSPERNNVKLIDGLNSIIDRATRMKESLSHRKVKLK